MANKYDELAKRQVELLNESIEASYGSVFDEIEDQHKTLPQAMGLPKELLSGSIEESDS